MEVADIRERLSESLRLVKLELVSQVPLEEHEALSKDLGVRVLVKREDQADEFGCGNKLRKLSYVVPYALEQNASVLVTAGSLPSNQCKAVAKVARQVGLRAHVVYGGDTQERPENADGSYLLTTLFEPTISWFEHSSWTGIGGCVDKVVEAEKQKGEKPFIIESGVSAWPGIMGSIDLGLEVIEQADADRAKKVHVIAPAGSGGTCLGISIAIDLLGLPWRVHGICIGQNASLLMKEMSVLRENAASHIKGLKPEIRNLTLYDFALGEGYDLPREAELEEMALAVRDYQLIFDPNYMLKAFLGLKKLVKQGIISQGETVILVHTGGQTGIFDNNLRVSQWHRNKYPAATTSAPRPLSL